MTKFGAIIDAEHTNRLPSGLVNNSLPIAEYLFIWQGCYGELSNVARSPEASIAEQTVTHGKFLVGSYVSTIEPELYCAPYAAAVVYGQSKTPYSALEKFPPGPTSTVGSGNGL
jgi:hypothetical protein